MVRLHLGSGGKNIHGWINIDIREECNPDMILDTSKTLPWDNEVDVIYSCHNLEHYKRNEIPQIIKNWYNALKPEGILRLSVPNFEAICQHYLYYKDLPKLYGLLHGGLRNEFDVHFISFDFETLEKILLGVGFRKVVKYDRWKIDTGYIDDYSAATLNPPFSKEGFLMSLNIEAIK